MIHDRIVVGVRDERIQRRLLSEAQGQLTLKTAIEVALGMEAAAKNAQVLSEGMKDSSTSSSTTSTTVNKLGQKQTATGTSKSTNHKYKCWRCSGPHRPDECRFKESECHRCHRRVHLQKNCKVNQKTTQQPDHNGSHDSGKFYYRGKGRKSKGLSKTKYLLEENVNNGDPEEGIYSMFSLMDQEQRSRL